MLGTALNGKGGIASVIRVYNANGLFSRWPVTYLATHSGGSAATKLRMAVKAWGNYVGWLFRSDFVLHVHSASRASFWRKAAFVLPAAWTGRPVVFHLHGGEFMRFYENECGPLKRHIVRYVLGNCDWIIVLSESWRTVISHILPTANIQVIVNPALPWNERVSVQRAPGVLLFLGRLGRGKGIYVLLDALKAVIKRHPYVRLLCGGDGEIDDVRRVANKLGLETHVEILGWVDEGRRTKLLANSSIYVLPSYAEGLPMSMLEAMSAGLPIVTTCVGGIPDAITHGVEGLLVPPGDAKALSAAICSLLDDSRLRETMGARAQSRFDACFSADVVIPKIEAIYRDLGVPQRGAV